MSFEESQPSHLSQPSGSVGESPLSGETLLDNSGTPFGQSSINSNLPSRQKQSGVQQFNVNLGLKNMEYPAVRQASENSSPMIEGAGPRMNADMDVSPDMSASDRNHPPSDQPTPSTQNSSSNTSFTPSGTDYPSPQKHQQRHSSTTNSSNSMNQIPMSSNNHSYLEDVSSSAHYFTSDSANPDGAVGAENPFSMPAAWDYPTGQTPSDNIEAVIGGMSGMTPTESQWAQMLEGSSWENWRT